MIANQQLTQLIAPAVAALGFELWGIEVLTQGHKKIIRVYIDREAGINVDHCAQASHQISGVLDIEDPIPGEYTLEVSSPGWDRLLFSLEQFAKYRGERVNVRLNLPIAGRRRFSGVVTDVNDKSVLMNVDGESVTVSFAAIKKARLQPEIAIGKGKK